MADARNAFDFWLWPLQWSLDLAARAVAPEIVGKREIPWTTPNEIIADLTTMRLRRFSTSQSGKRPALVVAPFAIHDAGIADLAPGHSLVAALESYGVGPVALAEWKSATHELAGLSIDSCLSDLNIAVDLVGAPGDLIGLCQGGWLSLLYAAALPRKVRRLVVAGSPVDLSFSSSIAQGAQFVLPDVLDELIAAGGGVVSGKKSLAAFRASGGAESEARGVLQVATLAPEIAAAFEAWNARTLDLPGRYYADVLNWLFRQNRLAHGDFPVFGRPAPLSRATAPLYLLAGARDLVAPPAQVRAARDLVGAPPDRIEYAEADCGHLSLFMGARTLDMEWRRIAGWLRG